MFENKHLPILDSKHIVTTKRKLYNIKLVVCGDYTMVYYYRSKKMRNNNDNDDLNLKTKIVNNYDSSNNKILVPSNKIEDRSIIRSKLECQRLAKSNIKDWETFITLTFEDNITDLESANKRFRYFVDKVKRVKKDFKYLCITEFQKRGATHYHLLTNISINDKKLIYSQEDNKKFKHIKYWIDGFTSIEEIKGDPKKVIGYISKYMTKDIDNRLFNRHRYFYSRNLVRPKVSYIDLDTTKERDFYIKKIQDSSLIYQNEYINAFDNDKVEYLEFING